MKILAFSDLHCDLEATQRIVDASGSADVVVGAGDFGVKGENTTQTLELLRQIEAPVILVAGNHDDLDELSNFCAPWTNGYFLHGNSVEIKGQPFFGLGCEIPRRSDFAWNQTISEGEAAGLMKHCPVGSVLVTHTPPLGYCDLQRGGSHEGSQSILNAISKYKSKLHLCGHIHHAWGMKDSVAGCRVINLGPTINWVGFTGSELGE